MDFFVGFTSGLLVGLFVCWVALKLILRELKAINDELEMVICSGGGTDD